MNRENGDSKKKGNGWDGVLPLVTFALRGCDKPTVPFFFRTPILPVFFASLLFFLTTQCALADFQNLYIYKIDRAVTEDVDVIRQTSSNLEVAVPENKLRAFTKSYPHAELLEIQSGLKTKATPEGYHSFTSIEVELKRLALKHYKILRLTAIGRSREEKPIYVLKISNSLGINPKQILFTAATHGDELVSVEVILGLINGILKDLEEKNTEVIHIVDNFELYFIPVVNPDGFIRQHRFDHEVDANRQYPWPEQPDRISFGVAGLVKRFFDSKKFIGSIDYHAAGEWVMYPWSYTFDPLSFGDKIRFREIAHKVAEITSYKDEQISKAMYVSKGCSADYFYWSKNTLALGIELANDKVPAPHDLPDLIEKQKKAALHFIKHFQ